MLTAACFAAVASCTGPSTLSPDPAIATSAAVVPETNVTIDNARVLASHNAIRKTLGIPPLSWSTNLEALSADWVNYLVSDAGCVVRRRGIIGLPVHKNGIGENFQLHEPQRWDDGRVEVADIDENDVVVAWAKQALDYDYKTNSCASNKNCEDFKQVVWKDSQVMGCAAASCPNMQQIWVCNYDPPGNFIGQKPY